MRRSHASNALHLLPLRTRTPNGSSRATKPLSTVRSLGLFPHYHPLRAAFSWISDPNALADQNVSDEAKANAKNKLDEFDEPY